VSNGSPYAPSTYPAGPPLGFTAAYPACLSRPHPASSSDLQMQDPLIHAADNQPNEMHRSLPGLPIPPSPGVLERSANARPVDTCSQTKCTGAYPACPSHPYPASSSDLQMQDPLIHAADNQPNEMHRSLPGLPIPPLPGVLERSANASPINTCSRQPNKMHKSLPGLPIPPSPGVLERSANARPIDIYSR
jgi:hypothetical protein